MQLPTHPWYRLVMAVMAVEAVVAAIILALTDVTSPRLAAVFALAPQPLWALVFCLSAPAFVVGVVRPVVGKYALVFVTAIWAVWVASYAVFFVLAPTSPLFLMVAGFLVAGHFLLIACPEAGLWI